MSRQRFGPADGWRSPPDPAELRRQIDALLDDLWGRGWTPEDVVQVASKRANVDYRRLAARIVAADGRRRAAREQPLHPSWTEQIDTLAERHGVAAETGLGLDDSSSAEDESRLIATALGLLILLRNLGPIPRVLPPPGVIETATLGHLDQRVLRRVRALLAKAESTEFEEEAEALTAKAQELIARHAVDEALLHADEDVGAPTVRRLYVDDPYADAKALLLAEVGAANDCSVVYTAGFGWVTVFGFGGALDAVELLGTSLLAQATAAMARHGPRRDGAGRSRTRAFRRSFLLGFAARIGQRLRGATETAVSDATSRHSELLPVLVARRERVDRAVQEAFPTMKRRVWGPSDAGGWAAGKAAADEADISLKRGPLSRGTGSR